MLGKCHASVGVIWSQHSLCVVEDSDTSVSLLGS